MIGLAIVPLAQRRDLCDDLLPLHTTPPISLRDSDRSIGPFENLLFVLDLLRDLLRDLFLLGIEIEDRAPVLYHTILAICTVWDKRLTASAIGTLAIDGRGIMCPIEKLDELAIPH